MREALIRLARRILQNVQSQLAQVLNEVEEQVRAPLRQMVQMVTGGMWIGRGADAFVEEVTSLLIPDVDTKVSENVSQMRVKLQTAEEIMVRADEEVEALIRGRLSDKFKFY